MAQMSEEELLRVVEEIWDDHEATKRERLLAGAIKERLQRDSSAGVSDEVIRAVERMCQPLDVSRLSGVTASEDARCMAVIREFILGPAAPSAPQHDVGRMVEKLKDIRTVAKAGKAAASSWAKNLEVDFDVILQHVETALQSSPQNAASVGSGWISVEERLPAIGERVLAFTPRSERKVKELTRLIPYEGAIEFFWDHYRGQSTHVQKSVTHWMPLPPPPTHDSPEGGK